MPWLDCARGGAIGAAIRAVMGLRIDEEAERLGLDQVELGIEAYAEFGKGSRSIA